MQQEKTILEKKLDLLLTTGQLLMQSGADSNRIDRNISRVAVYLGIPIENLNMHFTYTTLMISVSDGVNTFTKFKKTTSHSVNMTIVSGISRLSWRALKHQYSLEEYEGELVRIQNIAHHYPRWVVLLMVGLACGGFNILFGCDLPALLTTCLAASIGLFVRQELHKQRLNNYMTAVIAAFVATSIAGLVSFTDWSTTPHHPIFASVLFLIPGVPLINSLDDMIDGFTIVGLTRAIVAFLTVLAIAFGMILAFKSLEIQDYSAILKPPHNLFIVAFAAMIAAGGFAILFNVPVRTLILCAVSGALAILVRNLLLYEAGLSLPFCTFCGALAVGFWTIPWTHTLRTPGHVISIPPVIPMIPGVLAYQSMIGFLSFTSTKGEAQVTAMTQMFESGITAVMTVCSISLGVAIPNIIDRFYSAEAKQERIEAVMNNRK